MSGANAAHTLPPGDRDDAPTLDLKAASASQPRDAVAGREPATGGGSLEKLAAVIDEAQLGLGEIRMALAHNDQPTALAAAWRLREALMVDVHTVAAELTRELAQARRTAIREELSQ